MQSYLTLSVGGVSPFSARGCHQELITVDQTLWKRTLSGALVPLGFFGAQQQKKYKTIITCQDAAPIAFGGIVPGTIINVGCIQRLWQCSNGPEVVLEKKAVDGSISVINEARMAIGFMQQCDHVTTLTIDIDAGDAPYFVSYRPVLCMRLLSYKLETKEWDMHQSWRMELEEV
jgi:hypothetical protein